MSAAAGPEPGEIPAGAGGDQGLGAVGPAPQVVVGVDLLEHDRLLRTHARFGDRFLRRVFTSTELEQADWRPERLVGRFAAKEACAKALGTGMIGVAWREIEVLRLAGGKPVLRLHGRAAARAALLGISAFDVSISDTATQAVAVVAGVGPPALTSPTSGQG